VPPYPRVFTQELPLHAGHVVFIQGWLHHLRRLGAVNFAVVRDGTGFVQVRLGSPLPAALQQAGEESVVTVAGRVVADPRAPGGYELHDPDVTVLESAAPLPFTLAHPDLAVGLPHQLDHAAVSLRHRTRRLALRLQAALAHGFRTTLRQRGFVEVFTPKVAGATAEGGAEVFAVDYFGTPAYLVQSPQLYKQMLVGSLERVFEVGPVFRAEPHDTGRHLAQYTSLDVEMGFIRDHHDLVALLREVVAGMVEAGVQVAGAEAGRPDVPEAFPVVHFADAMELLERAGVRRPDDPEDLTPAGERWLCAWAEEQWGTSFLVVEGYPLASRPFYTHFDPDRPGYSRGFDLLFRGLEVVTGGQRLHRLADYERTMAERHMNPEPFAAYLDAFRFGMPPHGGFAIGLERMVKQWLGAGNIRAVTAFPRYRGRLAP
jgi:nondiscriminating aspartyl-tRNA synthetase